MTVFAEMGNYSTLSQNPKSRDPRWLQVEVCREFSRDRCLRADDECRFAHPPPGCLVEDGKVTACFDAMKGRCQREKCKYLHPPDHIKSHLETLGRSFQHTRSRTLSQQAMLSEMLSDMRIHPVAAEQHPGYAPHSMEQGYIPHGAEAVTFPTGRHHSSHPRRIDKSDKLRVCDSFLNGSCPLGEDECAEAHSPEHITIDADGFVTVCMDFVKGHCQRNTCRYFHPPRSMVAKVRAVQYRPSYFPKGPQQPRLPFMHHSPYMFMHPYYQQQVVNAPMYQYPPYMSPGMPQQAFMVPNMPYGVPSPPPFPCVIGEGAAFASPGEIQAVGVVPASPASTLSIDSSCNSSTSEQMPLQ